MRRNALILFGVLFVLLFAGVALAVGVGSSSPSVPPGDVAIVEDAPRGTGTISKAELDQAMLQAVGFSGQKRPPKPGEEGYEQVKSEALSGLISAVWLRGQAEAMGIVVSDEEVAAELEQSGEAKNLRKAHFTRKTMYERVRGQMLVTAIEEELAEAATKAAGSGIGPKRLEEEKQEAFHEFDLEFRETWQARTYCADGFVSEQCANYPAFAHPASPCYEADPKTPVEGCPAPVRGTLPALPGSVTTQDPEGERLVQRPIPEPE